MRKPTETKTIEHVDPKTASLPSMHINHAAVFLNELDTRIMGFDSGIAAVVADMEGMQKAYEREQAELATKHAEEIERRHILKRDLERGRAMALAAREVYSADIPADIE